MKVFSQDETLCIVHCKFLLLKFKICNKKKKTAHKKFKMKKYSIYTEIKTDCKSQIIYSKNIVIFKSMTENEIAE